MEYHDQIENDAVILTAEWLNKCWENGLTPTEQAVEGYFSNFVKAIKISHEARKRWRTNCGLDINHL